VTSRELAPPDREREKKIRKVKKKSTVSLKADLYLMAIVNAYNDAPMSGVGMAVKIIFLV
jgi:hypothetical protein